MKAKQRFIHIAAILLTGIFLMQTFIFLIPDEPEVLCIAEDHVAVESSADLANGHQISYAVSDAFHQEAIQSPGRRHYPNCTDIMLFTRVLKTDKTVSVKPAVRFSNPLSACINHTFHWYADNNPIHSPGIDFPSVKDRHDPEGIIPLLL